MILLEWGLVDVAGDAELIVSELVTNAVRATADITGSAGTSPVRLSLTARRDGVQIEVWDADSDLPRPTASAAYDAPGGRGLLIVAELSTRHGSYPTEGGGKCVYALVEHRPTSRDSR